jgi:hypothetical protein
MPVRYRSAFCVQCNQERPLVRNHVRGPKYACAVCRDPVRLPNIRGAKPTRSKHTGVMFQSQEESKREPDLIALEQAGEIKDLRCEAWRDRRTNRYSLDVFGNQPVADLIVAANDLAVSVRQARDGGEDILVSQVRRVEAAIDHLRRAKHHVKDYTPDYEYTVVRTEQRVTEDVKSGSGRRGTADPQFSVSRRLMLACYGIEVQCVYGSGRNIFGRRTG